MRDCIQRASVLLLTVFVVGGLLSPLAHRFSHVHNLDHRHGGPAAGFSWSKTVQVGYGGSEFLVEEHTPAHDLNCDLCGRIGFQFSQAAVCSGPVLVDADRLSALRTVLSGRTFMSARIRAPPAAS